jgi:hypothetical protein
MKISNWKTTLGAVIAGGSQILGGVNVPVSDELQGGLLVVGLAIIGIFAKDKDVTGGTRKN